MNHPNNSMKRTSMTNTTMSEQQRPERPAPLKIQVGQGAYAFTRGWLNNQYHPESVAGKEWQRGFDMAYYDNLARITKQ